MEYLHKELARVKEERKLRLEQRKKKLEEKLRECCLEDNGTVQSEDESEEVEEESEIVEEDQLTVDVKTNPVNSFCSSTLQEVLRKEPWCRIKHDLRFDWHNPRQGNYVHIQTAGHVSGT